MDNEIELISDGDGLAVIGDPTAVERFIGSLALPSRDLGTERLGSVMRAGAQAAQTGSEIAAESGRWVKLTEESAQAVRQFGLMPTKTPRVSHAMIGDPGHIQQWIQIVKSPAALATNPAMLAGAAGIMAQLAMQQSMAEITDYLVIIDQKLDDVLRAQTNQVLARMDGVDLAVKEATSVRDSVGRVSEVTWSKVQNSSGTIHETQGYALRQLGDLADKLERNSKVDELADITKEAEAEVQKWLAVLARCFQLHDAVAVLELDRVLDASPEELDRHRVGLKAAREDRIELISQSTGLLLQRMQVAVGIANKKILMNPIQSPSVVKSSNRVVTDVDEFHAVLGLAAGGQSSEAAKWKDAASDRWDKTLETGAGGVNAAKRFGKGTLDQASSAKDKLSGRFGGLKLRRNKDDEESAEQD